MKFLKLFSTTNFLLIFLCFFLPFVRSCGHEEKAEATSQDSSQVKKEDTTAVLQTNNSFVNYLEVPVRFHIDGGGLDSTATITVQKGSTIVQKITDEKDFTLKLDFNADYTLVFSQHGYISKKITFNTIVSANRIKQGFEPYPFEITLFKQYAGLDTSIFNQPVAKIEFSDRIDEFDYDVLYAKSIKSALKAFDATWEIAKEKADVEAKAKEESKAKAETENDKQNILLNLGNHLMYPSYPSQNDISGVGLLVIGMYYYFYLLLFLSAFIFTILGFIFSLRSFIKKEKRLFQFSIIVFLGLLVAVFSMPNGEFEKILYGYWITLSLAFLNMLINGIIFKIYKIKK